jgi:hypothetical protein
VPTATGHLTLAVIRDATGARQGGDLMDIAWAAVAAEQAQRSQEVLDKVVDSLFEVGLSLQAAIDLPGEVARRPITHALQQLDDAIREIRDHALTTRALGASPDPAPPGGAQ